MDEGSFFECKKRCLSDILSLVLAFSLDEIKVGRLRLLTRLLLHYIHFNMLDRDHNIVKDFDEDVNSRSRVFTELYTAQYLFLCIQDLYRMNAIPKFSFSYPKLRRNSQGWSHRSELPTIDPLRPI